MIRHVTLLIVAAVAAGLLPVAALAQSPSAGPVDVRASLGPQPVMVDGRARLLYELHLTNFSPKPIEPIALGADSVRLLATLRGEELEKILLAVGPADSTGKKPWKPRAGEAPVVHRRELPNDNAVIAFPSTSGR